MLMDRENDRLSLPSGFLERLESDDPEAWLEFFQKVYTTAREAIDDALATSDRPGVKEARRLVRAYQDDAIDAHLALDMAWTSFQSHFLDRSGSPEIRTEADCAALLIRVAYNRWQRVRYRDRQVRRQAALGASGAEGPSLIAQHPDLGPGPEEEVALADFEAALGEEVAHFTRHLRPADRLIVHLTFFERRTPREIKDLHAISEAKTHDVLRLWRLHLIQRFPKTLGLLGQDPDRE